MFIKIYNILIDRILPSFIMKKMYKVASLIILSFFCLFSTAHGDISISPLKHEITLEPWKTAQRIIKVKNDWDTAITLYSSKEDFLADGESGFPRFIKPQNLPNPELSLTHWITLENESITLAPGESKQVRFSVKAPLKSDPGGHYGVIFFWPEAKPGAQLSVIQRLGVLLLINVPGEVTIAWDFKDVEVWNIEKNKFIPAELFNDFPITFSVLFNNSWNTHLKPKWKIELLDKDWNILRQVGKEKILSQAGAFVWEKVVDYIPVNETFGNVLPNSDRRFLSKWEWFGYNLINETTWKKEVKFKNLSDYYTQKTKEEQEFIKFYQSVKQKTVTNPITANYDLSYEGKDQILKQKRGSYTFLVTYQQTYIGLNSYMIALVIIILIAGWGYMIVIRPKQIKKKEEMLRKKIMEEISTK